MGSEVFTAVDEAVAIFLVSPSSANALSIIRKARRIQAVLSVYHDKEHVRIVKRFQEDAHKLHDSILTLETDPQIVKHNLLARVITAVFPVMNTLEDLRNIGDKDIYGMFMNGLSTVAEISTATQYLEGTRVIALAHFERAMVSIESRLSEIIMNGVEKVPDGLDALENFTDSLRNVDIPPRERPFLPFVLWTLILVISYRELRSTILDP